MPSGNITAGNLQYMSCKMSTTYGDRLLRVTFTSSDSSGVAEFFDGSEIGAIGITVPRFSTTERNNLTAGSVKQGMIIFNETDGKMQIHWK